MIIAMVKDNESESERIAAERQRQNIIDRLRANKAKALKLGKDDETSRRIKEQIALQKQRMQEKRNERNRKILKRVFNPAPPPPPGFSNQPAARRI